MTDASWNTTDEAAEPAKKQAPLWKQLMGAGVGMMVALALYQGYKIGAPVVTAYLVPPGGFAPSALDGESAFANKEAGMDDNAGARMGSRIRQQAQAALEARPDAIVTDSNGEIVMEPSEPVVLQADEGEMAPAPQPIVPTYIAPDTEQTLATLRPIINGTDATRSGAPAEGKGDDGKGKGKPDPVPTPTPTPVPSLPDSGPSFWLFSVLALGGALGTPSVREKLFRLA